jgi:thiamine-monophosphate kinase
MAEPTLADLGEGELIRRLGAFAPPGQFNDDAALLPALDPSRRQAVVVNTDVLVEGVHFSEATTEPQDVGWRSAAANLSDLAAMGCVEVVGLTVGLVAPASTAWAWVEGVYGGLQEALRIHGGVLLGGDCSGGGQRILAITAIGLLAGEETAEGACSSQKPQAAAHRGAIRRGDGRPGDWLVCTGPHGLSRLGLALLQGTLPSATARLLDQGLRERAIRAHRRPQPRFDAVRALIDCRPAGAPWRVGGCDSSDGLAAAVVAIAASSGCQARLERLALPLEPAMAQLSEAESWCLGGGEDFELVLALEPAWAEALLALLPGCTRIGALGAGPAGNLCWSNGAPWPESSCGSEGFRHFG